jgi:alkylation response protein AidB-like acyl-CoA dehydrogenase
MRQRLADVYAHERLREFVAARTLASAAGDGAPGPSGSIGKLLWTRSMTRIGSVAADLLGPRMIADTGEWGTYAWTKQVLGAPGYRIAGGSDEIQHDIIANRVLGLPAEPRIDKGVAFRNVPR